MTDVNDQSTIESVLHEDRIFEPSASVAAAVGGAYVGSMDEYRAMYERSIADPDGFWAEQAGALDWFRPWDTVVEWNLPDARWFDGATTNVCHNCVDRQIAAGFGDQVAIIWEGEPVGNGWS